MNNLALYIITVVIWGSTWIAINYQLGEVAVEASIVYRFALAAAILFIYCWIKKLPLTFSKKQHLQFIAFGVSLFGLNYYLLYSAQQYINSALTCIAFSTLMLMNIINARFWYKTPITKQVYIGGAIGLIGITTLFWPEISNVELGGEVLFAVSLCLIGTLSASNGNMLSIKNQKMKLPVMQVNAWGMLYGSLFLLIVAVVQGKEFSFEWSVPYVSSLLFLSIFGSVIAFGCYLTLLDRIGAHKASYANLMFPAVAVIISTFVEGFVWSSYTVVGMVCIVIGNLVVLTKPKKSKTTAAKPQAVLIENS